MSLAQYRVSKRTDMGLDKLLVRRKDDKYHPLQKFDRQKHCDAKLLADTSRSSLLPQLDKKKIYQKICEWYETWSVTQQKVLLCGLTKVCTTTQLESIATSIEPLFHTEVMRQRNPLRPLNRRLKKKKRKQKPQTAVDTRTSEDSDGSSLDVPPSEAVLSSASHMSGIQEEDDLKEVSEPRETLSPLPSAYGGVDVQTIQQRSALHVATGVVDEAMDEAMSMIKSFSSDNLHDHSAKKTRRSQPSPTHPVPNISLTQPKTQKCSKSPSGEKSPSQERSESPSGEKSPSRSRSRPLTPFGQSPTRQRSPSGQVPFRAQSPGTGSRPQSPFDQSLLRPHSPGQSPSRPLSPSGQRSPSRPLTPFGQSPCSPSVPKSPLRPLSPDKKSPCPIPSSGQRSSSNSPTRPKSPTFRGKKVSRSKQKKLALAALDDRVTAQHHNALVGHSLTALKPISVGQSLISVHSRHRYNVSSQISISQFFSSYECQKKMLTANFEQTSPLLQRVKTKSDTTNNRVPLTRKYGPPEKEKLGSIFKEQMRQIWEWVDGWKTHERLEFIAMVVKMSSTDLLTYLAHCLCQRLQERVDITWLPDNLLVKIFILLSTQDILACSEVCRRWYYVAATEELWMQKCRELGEANGIPHTISLILEMNKDKDDLDWRTAYSELETNAEERKLLRDRAKMLAGSDTPKTTTSTKTPSSAKSIMSQLPNIRRWAKMVQKGPSMKLGRQLAEDSAKLKEKYRILLQNKKTRGYALRLAYGGEGKDDDEERFETDEESDEQAADMLKKSEMGPKDRRSGERRFAIRRATSVMQIIKDNTAKDLQVDSKEFKSSEEIPHSAEESDSLTNSLYEEKQGPEQNVEKEHALDVWHDPVQAQEELGRDPHSYLDGWICLTAMESDETERPKRGGIQSVRRVRKFVAHVDAVLSFVYDRKRFISGGLDRSIRIWDFRTQQSVHKLLGHKGGVGCLFLDTNKLYSGSWDTAVMVWDLKYFERIAVLNGHRGSVSDVRLVHHKLLSASHDGTVRIWNTECNYDCINVLELHTKAIMSMIVDHVENTLITGSSDKTIKITSLQSHKTIHTLQSKDPIHTMLLQAGLIISANNSGKVTFWNKYEGTAEAMIKCHEKRINSLGFRGGCFYTASDDMTVKEWDLMTLTCLRSLVGCKGKILQIQIQKRFMVTVDTTGSIRIWDFYSNMVIADDREEEDVIPVKQLHESELEAYLRGDKKEEEKKEEEETQGDKKEASSASEPKKNDLEKKRSKKAQSAKSGSAKDKSGSPQGQPISPTQAGLTKPSSTKPSQPSSTQPQSGSSPQPAQSSLKRPGSSKGQFLSTHPSDEVSEIVLRSSHARLHTALGTPDDI